MHACVSRMGADSFVAIAFFILQELLSAYDILFDSLMGFTPVEVAMCLLPIIIAIIYI